MNSIYLNKHYSLSWKMNDVHCVLGGTIYYIGHKYVRILCYNKYIDFSFRKTEFVISSFQF